MNIAASSSHIYPETLVCRKEVIGKNKGVKSRKKNRGKTEQNEKRGDHGGERSTKINEDKRDISYIFTKLRLECGLSDTRLRTRREVLGLKPTSCFDLFMRRDQRDSENGWARPWIGFIEFGRTSSFAPLV